MSVIDAQQTSVQAEVQADEGGRVTVVLRGALDVQTMGGLWRQLEARLRRLKVVALEVDATALHLCGDGGLALLHYLKMGGFTPTAKVTLRGLSKDVEQLLWLFGNERPEAAPGAGPQTAGRDASPKRPLPLARTPRRGVPTSLPEEIGSSV